MPASIGGKLIALTFDDGPGPYTSRLLDGLAARGVKATFFMLGQNVERYTKTVRRIYDEGHQVASHTYDHPALTTKSDSQVCWQINHTADILNEITGLNTNYLLRPPYGDCNSRILSLIGTPAILWSIDPEDWKSRNAYTVRDRIVSNAFDGAIILAHDIYSTTVDGALMAVDKLLAQGYEFVTVSELFRRRGISLENGKRYYSCKPTGTDLGPITAPVIRQEPVYGGMSVAITAAAGAKIYYTTDGSRPTGNSAVYKAPFAVREGQVIRAFASFNLNGGYGPESRLTVTGGVTFQIPTVRAENGYIVFDNPNPNTDVRMTMDQTWPQPYSMRYSEPIPMFDGVLYYRVVGMGGMGTVYYIYVSKRGNLYWDVPVENWYFETVDRAVSLGLFHGVDEYAFWPEGELTRGMFVTVIRRLLEMKGYVLTVPETTGFSDVPDNLWYSEAVAWAAAEQLVLGYEDATFRPERSITREEMCVILDRVIQWLEQRSDEQPEDTASETEPGETAIPTEETEPQETEPEEMPEPDEKPIKPEFSDTEKISPWALESVARMTQLGLILGRENRCFFPQSITTRAEAATVILRLYDLLTV